MLITSGPTWVAVDSMRVISNRSSGRMGKALANELKKTGAKITLLEGPVTYRMQIKGVAIRQFKYYDELASLLRQELKNNYAVVVHAAAVSDYRLKKIFSKKISSRLSSLKLGLVPTKKLINEIKRIDPKTFLVGFKLEAVWNKNSLFKKTRDLFKKAHCDLVVANQIGNKSYQGILIDQTQVLAQAPDRKTISKHLVEAIKERL